MHCNNPLKMDIHCYLGTNAKVTHRNRSYQFRPMMEFVRHWMNLTLDDDAVVAVVVVDDERWKVVVNDDGDVANAHDAKPYNRENFVAEDSQLVHLCRHLLHRMEQNLKRLEKIIRCMDWMDCNRSMMDVVNDEVEEDEDVSNDDDHRAHWLH